MIEDLLKDLMLAEKLATGNSPNAARLYRAARLEIERCHARLEIDHHFVLPSKGTELIRRETPYAERFSIPDAVECRDATISLIERDQ